jgi:hypothetical protein
MDEKKFTATQLGKFLSVLTTHLVQGKYRKKRHKHCRDRMYLVMMLKISFHFRFPDTLLLKKEPNAEYSQPHYDQPVMSLYGSPFTTTSSSLNHRQEQLPVFPTVQRPQYPHPVTAKRGRPRKNPLLGDAGAQTAKKQGHGTESVPLSFAQ